jgi:hypothetical protein
MSFTLDIASGAVDEGDSKRLEVAANDGTDPASLAALSIAFTAPSGTVTEYTLSDTTVSGDVRLISHTFTEGGVWRIDALAEGVQGNTERSGGTVLVRGKRRD